MVAGTVVVVVVAGLGNFVVAGVGNFVVVVSNAAMVHSPLRLHSPLRTVYRYYHHNYGIINHIRHSEMSMTW